MATDIIGEIEALKGELMRLKSNDRARPMIADVPMNGSYMVPAMGDRQAIIVTVRSDLKDWPQFSATAYDMVGHQIIDSPPIYRITESGLTNVNRFAIPIGRVAAGAIRLDWLVLSQSGLSVNFGVQ